MALGYTGLGRYGRREAKARVAAGSGGLGGPFIGARRRRRRPTATGDAKESLGFGGERSIRIELECTDFQTILADDSKREKVEEIPRIISARPGGLGRLGRGGEREGFGPTFGPKPKEDFLKPF